jgi:hypothetical protein
MKLFEVSDGAWGATDQTYPVEVFDNVLTASVPVDDVVEGGNMFVTSAAYDPSTWWVCDQVGLSEETGLPGIDLGPLTYTLPYIDPAVTVTESVTISYTGQLTWTIVNRVDLGIGSDVSNHGPNIPMSSPRDVTVTIAIDTFAIKGLFPWVSVAGEVTDAQNQKGFGSGTVAGFSNVQVSYIGQLDPLEGWYAMGVGGRLPTGEPISYTVRTIEQLAVYSSTQIITGSGTTQPLMTPTPPPELANPTLEAQEFYLDFNNAFALRDVDWLFSNLHPKVFEVYRPDTCRTYLEGVVSTPIMVGVQIATGPGPWTWIQDGISTPIDNAYTVIVNLTAQGQTNQQEVHLAPGPGGNLNWFTDCGVPNQ